MLSSLGQQPGAPTRAPAPAPLAHGGIDPVFEFREIFEELREPQKAPPKPLTAVLKGIDPASSPDPASLHLRAAQISEPAGVPEASRPPRPAPSPESSALDRALASSEAPRRAPPSLEPGVEGDAIIEKAQSRLIRLDIAGDAARRKQQAAGSSPVWLTLLSLVLVAGFCHLAFIASRNDGIVDLRRLPEATRAAMRGESLPPRFVLIQDLTTGSVTDTGRVGTLPLRTDSVRATAHARSDGSRVLLVDGEVLLRQSGHVRGVRVHIEDGSEGGQVITAGLSLDLEAVLTVGSALATHLESRHAAADELVFEGPVRIPFSTARELNGGDVGRVQARVVAWQEQASDGVWRTVEVGDARVVERSLPSPLEGATDEPHPSTGAVER